MQGANRDAPSNRITTTQANAVVDVSVDADGNTPDGVKFVNDGRRAVRDGWAGKGNVAISNVIVGDDGGGLSRSNTQLNNQVASASASEALPDSTTAEYSASITQTGVEEIGLEEADGTLFARATFDSPVDLNGTVTFTVAVSNDTSVSRGVITNDGQTAVRDVIADNSPALPNEYAYGSDGTAVAESDSALGTELTSESLDEILIQRANSASAWGNITTLAATDPFGISGSELAVLQSAFSFDALTDDTASGNVGVTNDDAYNGGQAFLYTDGASFAEFQFTPEYTIENVGIQARVDASASSDISFLLNGAQFDQFNGSGASLDWYDVGSGFFSGSNGFTGTLEAGETYTLRVQANDTSTFNLDVISVYDTRYTYDFPNPDAATNGGGILDGPQLYPDEAVVSLSTAQTRRNVTEANFTSTWTDTSNNQFVELANDGSTFTRFNNASSGSVTFAGAERDVDANIGFSRYTTNSGDYPATGDTGQAVSDWQLFANPDAVVPDNIGATLTRGVVPPNTIDGSTVREAGIKSNSTLLTRHEIAEFTVESDQRLSSAETTLFKGPE
jgi:hypothetical protein